MHVDKSIRLKLLELLISIKQVVGSKATCALNKKQKLIYSSAIGDGCVTEKETEDFTAIK